MKRMSYVMLCMFGLMAGCDNQYDKPPTVEQAKAYEAQETMTIRQDGYQPVVLNRICLDGVEYYHRMSGHAAWLAPVVDKTTLLFKPCGLP